MTLPDKRDIILDCGVSSPDAILNALHQVQQANAPYCAPERDMRHAILRAIDVASTGTEVES